MKTTMGRAFPDGRGQFGCRVTHEFSVEEYGVFGIYHVPSHGRSPREIVAEREVIKARHVAFAARFLALDEVRAHTFTASSASFTVKCCTLRVADDVGTLELIAIAASDDGKVKIDLRSFHNGAAAVPTNAEIIAAIEAHAAKRVNGREDAATKHETALAAALGIG